MHRHADRFSRNPRTAMAYRTWDKMDTQVKQQLLHRGELYLQNIENL
jgi:deoxyribodipyrimidine photolyase-related protein